jgi:hypothetical protein
MSDCAPHKEKHMTLPVEFSLRFPPEAQASVERLRAALAEVQNVLPDVLALLDALGLNKPKMNGAKHIAHHAKWRTPERAEKLRSLWPDGTPTREIRVILESDGGNPVPSEHYLGVWAAKLGLRRPWN